MEKYRVYILDDEPLALDVIEAHLEKFKQFEVCGKSTDPIAALGQLKGLKPDLLFLDIEMPDLNGLELIDSLQTKSKVIITTAYREYAVEGFDLNVLDYLVKPIPFKRFVKAIDRFLEVVPSSLVPTDTNSESFIFVRAERKSIKVELDKILYLQGVKDYVKIVLEDQQILTKASIGNFYEKLPKDHFLRIHKSYVVARDKITAFTAQDVEIGEVEIPIGRSYKEAFLKEVQ